MKEAHITVALYPSNTLAETWKQLAETFAVSGAEAEQIITMRMVFYLGAAQAYARIDGNTKSFPSFCDIMQDIHVEIDDVIGHDGVGKTMGNA